MVRSPMRVAMKKSFAALALVAALADPSSAVTFPSLTTTYVGAGVADSGNNPGVGIATAFHCINVSGVATSVRFVVLSATGAVVASITRAAAHGATVSVATHTTSSYFASDLATGLVSQGGVNIESLQSGVFCNAMTIDAADSEPVGVTLPLVRVNPHPGTVE
jgi:hypothetical protein